MVVDVQRRHSANPFAHARIADPRGVRTVKAHEEVGRCGEVEIVGISDTAESVQNAHGADVLLRQDDRDFLLHRAEELRHGEAGSDGIAIGVGMGRDRDAARRTYQGKNVLDGITQMRHVQIITVHFHTRFPFSWSITFFFVFPNCLGRHPTFVKTRVVYRISAKQRSRWTSADIRRKPPDPR